MGLMNSETDTPGRGSLSRTGGRDRGPGFKRQVFVQVTNQDSTSHTTGFLGLSPDPRYKHLLASLTTASWLATTPRGPWARQE